MFAHVPIVSSIDSFSLSHDLHAGLETVPILNKCTMSLQWPVKSLAVNFRLLLVWCSDAWLTWLTYFWFASNTLGLGRVFAALYLHIHWASLPIICSLSTNETPISCVKAFVITRSLACSFSSIPIWFLSPSSEYKLILSTYLIQLFQRESRSIFDLTS